MANIRGIDITKLKAEEDAKLKLNESIKELTQKQKVLMEEVQLYAKLDEAKNSLFNVIEGNLKMQGFIVDRQGTYKLLATYGKAEVSAKSTNYEVDILEGTKLVETILISEKSNLNATTVSFTSSQKSLETIELENKILILQSSIDSMENFSVYYHLNEEIKETPEDVVNAIFK